MPANIKGAPTGSLEKAKRARCEGKGEMKSEQKSVKPLQARNANIPGPIYSPVPRYPRLQRDGASRSEVMPTYQASQKPIGLTLGTNGGWREWTKSSSQKQRIPSQTCEVENENKNVQCENTNPPNSNTNERKHFEAPSFGCVSCAKETMSSSRHCYPHAYPSCRGGCSCALKTSLAHENNMPNFFTNYLQGRTFCPLQGMQNLPEYHAESGRGCMCNGITKEACIAGPLQYQNEGNIAIYIILAYSFVSIMFY